MNIPALNPTCSSRNCGYATAVYLYVCQLPRVPTANSAEFINCILPDRASTTESQHIYMDPSVIPRNVTVHTYEPESSIFICETNGEATGVIAEVNNGKIPIQYLIKGDMCHPHPIPVTNEEFAVIKTLYPNVKHSWLNYPKIGWTQVKTTKDWLLRD